MPNKQPQHLLLAPLCGALAEAAQCAAMAKPAPKVGQRQYLRDWRKHRKLSQEELADRAGVTHGLISQLERGITGLTHDRLANLAAALDCSAADLLAGPPSDAKAPSAPTAGDAGLLLEALGLFSQLSEARQRRIIETIEDAARAEGLPLQPPSDRP